MDSPSLTDDQLNNLLDECARTMSRATQETTSIATSRSTKTTSRISLYENTPHLPEPVLQKLLHDARKELAGEERTININMNRRGKHKHMHTHTQGISFIDITKTILSN